MLKRNKDQACKDAKISFDAKKVIKNGREYFDRVKNNNGINIQINPLPQTYLTLKCFRVPFFVKKR